jgi:hypothetical protein
MPGKHISPGVLTQEIDISNIVPMVATTIGGIVGTADRGPVIGDDDCPTLVTSSQQFIDYFGEPDGDLNQNMHYAALQYLQAGNTLYVVRAAADEARYANASVSEDGTIAGPGISIAGYQVAEEPPLPDSGKRMMFRVYAKEPGTPGNSLAICVINYTDWAELGEHIIDGDSENFYVNDPPRKENEFILAVYDGNDNAGWVESFTVSRLKTKRNAAGSSKGCR